MNPVGGAQKSAKSFSGEIRKSEGARDRKAAGGGALREGGATAGTAVSGRKRQGG
jgi:hypothetical protein